MVTDLTQILLRGQPGAYNQLGQPTGPQPATAQPNAFAPAIQQAVRPVVNVGPQTDSLARALMGSAVQSPNNTAFEALGNLAKLWSGNRQEEKFAEAQAKREAAAKAADRQANLEDFAAQEKIKSQYATPPKPDVKEFRGHLIQVNQDGSTTDLTPGLPSGYRVGNPEEQKAYGGTSEKPVIFDSDGKPFTIGGAAGPTVNVAGDEKNFDKVYGGKSAENASDISLLGDKAASNLQKGNLIRKFMDQVNTGSLAPTIKTVGAWAQSVGIDPSLIGIDPNTPANLQAIEGLSNSMIMGKIGPGGFPANNFSEQDRKFILTTIPQITDLKAAATIKLEVSNRLDQLAIDRANAWEEAQIQAEQDGQSLSDTYRKFSHDWRQKMSKMDIFSDLIKGTPAAAPATFAKPNVAKSPDTPADGFTQEEWDVLTKAEKATLQ